MADHHIDSLASNMLSFDIELSLTGDDGSGFHTKNNPRAPFQRQTIIQRRGAVSIQCTCVDVVHGRMAPGDAYATLLVLKFRFDQRMQARRISAVDIEIEFSNELSGSPRPEVHRISLDGCFSLAPTTQTEEVVKGAELSSGAAVTGIESKAGVYWQKTTAQEDVNDAATVTGCRELRNVNYGPENCASWTLLENETRKTGVPKSMQVGILLKRESNEPFRCFVGIKARADFKSRLEGLFGRPPPKDDPVFFDPHAKPTSNLMEYNVEALGKFDLESVRDVTFQTVLTDAIKVL